MSAAQINECPHCGADLWDGPATGHETRGRREIGHVQLDLIQFWSCPDCGGTWNRFAPDDRRYLVAEGFRLQHRRFDRRRFDRSVGVDG